MDQNEQNKISSNLTTYAGVLILGLLIGSIVTVLVLRSRININDTYQAGWDAAKTRLALYTQSNPIFAPKEVTSITGTVESISGGLVTIKITPLEPLADPLLDERVVTVSLNTNINRSVQKNPTEYQKEMEVFMKNIQQMSKTSTGIINPPSMFTKQSVQISDIKVGANITITASENIKNLKNFTATEVALK